MNKFEQAFSYLDKKDVAIAKRKIRIALARRNFWLFCKAIAPDFYNENKPHLKEIADSLQALAEDRIWKPSEFVLDKFGKKVKRPRSNTEWTISDKAEDVPNDAYVCDDFKMHIPPRHGKSRTLIYFECWLFGVERRNSIITVSYNDLTSTEFSRFVRDEIQKERNNDTDIVFSDVFPETKIKQDDGSVGKWSLVGSHFSYLGTGMRGSVTSKGGKYRVIDDPIKDHNVALNEIELDDQWTWYNDTFKSRSDAPQGRSKTILNFTRWATKDIAGRIESDPEERQIWFTLLMPVMNEETGDMLCDEIMDRESFYKTTKNMSQGIMRANYFQEPLDVQGRLYDEFVEYDELPSLGNIASIKMEVDPADTGKDFLCAITYIETKDKFAYVLDIVYDRRKAEKTLPILADRIISNGVAKVNGESNSGGRLYFHLLKQLLAEKHKWYRTIIKSEVTPSTSNKVTRILNMAETVNSRIFMPRNWKKRFDNFAIDVQKYIKGGRNPHDDGPDTLTRVAEGLVGSGGFLAVQKHEYIKDGQYVDSKHKPNRSMRVARVVRR